MSRGTTTVVAISRGTPTNVLQVFETPTVDVEGTFDAILTFLRALQDPILCIGVASFGPIDVDVRSNTFGFITTTPKQGWANVNVLVHFLEFNVPLGFNSDVQAAAMGEMVHGGHGVIESCCYVTVGTGVGVGIVSQNVPVSGLSHPEGGHIRVPRQPGDEEYKGCCPFHGDCLEGLTNAQSIADRLGVHPSALADIPDSHAVWQTIGWYLGVLASNLVLTVSPQVIVFGGGVMKRKGLLESARRNAVANLGGYLAFPEIVEKQCSKLIVRSVHDRDVNSQTTAGMVGALQLAYNAHWCVGADMRCHVRK